MRSDKEFKSKVMRQQIKFTMLADVIQRMNTAEDDDAISLALLILMEETEFVIEDIVDYEVDEKL